MKKQTVRKQKYLEYLESDEWAKIKVDLLILNNHKCQKCDSRRNLQVHHLSYKRLFREEPEDLILLCGRCHRKEHGIKLKRKRKPKVYNDGLNSKQRKRRKNRLKRKIRLEKIKARQAGK